jgi:CRP-like cAMP-binding protein
VLEELEEEDREALLPYLEERTHEEGRALFRSGQESEEVLFLIEGEARVDCKGISLCVVGPGDILGGLSLLIVGRRRCDVIASTPVRVLVLERAAYLRLRDEAPPLALVVQEAIVRTFARAVSSTEVAEPSASMLIAVDGSKGAD